MAYAELTPDKVDDVIAKRGYITDLGQIPTASLRHLKKEVRAGRLSKWRAYWTAPLGGCVGLGPLKTVYGLPHLSPVWPGDEA